MKPRSITVAPSDLDIARIDEIAAAQGATRYAVHLIALRIGLQALLAAPEAYPAFAVKAAADGRRAGRPRKS